ncbi:MAG: arylesterase [Sulfurospirillaceae bacterium]|nr:arylesterase [Sulfurospirillaceae bacterium]MDD3463172.1 arylesterase [Sulfurospirillaceae bacterium]
MKLLSFKTILILVILVFGVRYYQSTWKTDVQNSSLSRQTKILAFGDSLTSGYGVLPEQSYPSLLSELLHVKVFNEGISGELSSQGLARLPSLLERYQPDILLLCHGANDILQRKGLVQAKANIGEMVDMAQKRGIYVLLIGVPLYDILSFETASFYYEIAKEKGLTIEDKTLEKIMVSPELKSDQVHPNAKGYNFMAKSIAKLLVKHYKK